MSTFLRKIIGYKKEWRTMEARANALPRDYRGVYGEMKSYLWRFASGDGTNVIAVLRDILELFENGAATGSSVLDLTGRDVAAFCDAQMSGTTTYLDRWRDTLNRDVAVKLAP